MNIFTKLVKKIIVREKKESWGEEYPQKTFYIIRVDYNMAGMLAIVKSTLSHIIYAYEHNLVPVVDLLNCDCQYIDKASPQNVWETFFIQPAKFSLKDIERCKNIIISKNIQVPRKKYGFRVEALHGNAKLLEEYRDEYKQNIFFNPSTKEFVENKFKEIVGSKEKILGVLARGTDYLDCHPKGHPVQPNPKKIIIRAQEIMHTYGYKYVFLATEDLRIYNLFKETFGGQLLFSGQKLLPGMKDAKFISELKSSEGLNQKQDVLNYLATLYILSKCNAFIGGCTAGTLGAYMMSDRFEYEYFWNLGYYK